MAAPKTTAAFRGETDGYDIGRERLLGRHAAGHGLLRAAIAAADGQPIIGYGPDLKAAQAFADLVRSLDPTVQVRYALSDDVSALAQAGVLYLADPILGPPARFRLRAGPAAWSLCGVTHTTASTSAMDQIAGLFSEPVTSWDALICTSAAVVETVRVVHEAEADYLRWRLGPEVRLSTPQLPVIPLGVHTDDFAFSDEERANARRDLALEADEVCALYVARYSPYGKAHPLVMFQGLEAAARRTGRQVALVLCGWSATPGADELYRSSAAEFAPSVRVLFADGRLAAERNRAWASADLFVSLVDGVQETFGLTPIEAKAAALPVVCTDWNGYRDTVRDGVDGFRIPTWAPSAGMGDAIGRAFEAGTLAYDHYAWMAASTTSVDLGALTDRLSDLIADPGLRRRMGEAGRADARARFAWSKIYDDYQALWGELNARRLAAPPDAQAPRASPRRLDPFQSFGHYPTHRITAETLVSRPDGVRRETVQEMAVHRLFLRAVSPSDVQLAVWDAVAAAPAAVRVIAERSRLPVPVTARTIGVLAKMGMVRLG